MFKKEEYIIVQPLPVSKTWHIVNKETRKSLCCRINVPTINKITATEITDDVEYNPKTDCRTCFRMAKLKKKKNGE